MIEALADHSRIADQATVRERGYPEDHEARVHAIGAAVFDHTGEVLGRGIDGRPGRGPTTVFPDW